MCNNVLFSVTKDDYYKLEKKVADLTAENEILKMQLKLIQEECSKTISQFNK